MKFEKPIMNIDMFDMENVTTNASMTAVNMADKKADELISNLAEGSQSAKITITF